MSPSDFELSTYIILVLILFILITVFLVIVLIIVIVVPVKVTESNRYPNYTRLDYSLADTCEFDILPSPPWRLGTWHLKEIGVEVGYDEKPES